MYLLEAGLGPAAGGALDLAIFVRFEREEADFDATNDQQENYHLQTGLPRPIGRGLSERR